MRLMLTIVAGGLLGTGAPAPAARDPGAEHVSRARSLAGQQFAASMFLCEPQGGEVVMNAALHGSDQWLTPVRVFDDLCYI